MWEERAWKKKQTLWTAYKATSSSCNTTSTHQTREKSEKGHARESKRGGGIAKNHRVAYSIRPKTDLRQQKFTIYVCTEIYFIDAVMLLGFHVMWTEKFIFFLSLSFVFFLLNELNKINGSEWKASITANILLNFSLSVVYFVYHSHSWWGLCSHHHCHPFILGKWNKRQSTLCWIHTHTHTPNIFAFIFCWVDIKWKQHFNGSRTPHLQRVRAHHHHRRFVVHL